MAYGPTYLYSLFPPHKKIVRSRQEELEALQAGWQDTPFSEADIDAAARLAAEPEPSLAWQLNPSEPDPMVDISLQESLPNADRPDMTATMEGPGGEVAAPVKKPRGRPRKQVVEELI